MYQVEVFLEDGRVLRVSGGKDVGLTSLDKNDDFLVIGSKEEVVIVNRLDFSYARFTLVSDEKKDFHKLDTYLQAEKKWK